ncbi:MAG: PAS domain-containing protein [Alphaproteobacteria bacterium]|nr:PAS domain-containing protein [Alphaproteobacteria bacterium]
MDISDTIHHAKLLALYAYWNKICGGRDMPSRSNFDPVDIPHLLPNLILIDVERDPLRFRIRLYGTAIAGLRGRDLTGCYLDEPNVSNIVDLAVQANMQVVENKQPTYIDAPYPHHSGRFGHFYRLGLPLSANGTDVDMIIAGFYEMDTSLALAANL